MSLTGKSVAGAWLVIAMLTFSAFTAKVDAALCSTQISKWQNNAKGAYSFCFDDGGPGQYQYAVPILEQKGFLGTFFLIGTYVTLSKSVSTIGIPQMMDLNRKGHEIAYHTWEHIKLTTLSNNAITSQMQLQQDMFNKWGIDAVSMAYPYDSCNTPVKNIVKNFVCFGRNGSVLGNTPSTWSKLDPLLIKSSNPPEDLLTCVSQAITSGTWANGVFHGVGYTPGTSIVDFQSLVNTIAVMRDSRDLWVGTFRAVAAYIFERDHSSVQYATYDGHYINVLLNTSTNFISPFIVPLTLKTEIGPLTVITSVFAEGKPIPWNVITESGKRYIIYDVVPDLGEIKIQVSRL